MDWKVALWLSLFLALIIGYLLLLTVVLPSTLAYEPDWIRVGSFAEYSVDDRGGGKTPVMNGTYTWNVTSVEIQNGGMLVTINETFRGTTHWDHVAGWNNTEQTFDSTVPIKGRTTKISAAMGTVEDLILWLRMRNVLVVLAAFNVLYGLGYLLQVSWMSSQLTAMESSYAFYSGFMMLGLACTQLVVGWLVTRDSDARIATD